MITLEEYMITSVPPPAHRLPGLVSAVSSFIPLVGVGLHAGALSAHTQPPAFKDELENLIDGLERED